jgi:hypothetical protein
LYKYHKYTVDNMCLVDRRNLHIEYHKFTNLLNLLNFTKFV